jgi:tRNA-dihydrouridine synthase
MKAKTLLIGNGDVPNLEQARQKVAEFGIDGVMIGMIYMLVSVVTLCNHYRVSKSNSKSAISWPRSATKLGSSSPKHLLNGILLGRGIFGNPWLFSEYNPTMKEKIEAMLEHSKLFDEMLGEHKNFHIMKKHYKGK